VRRTQHGKECKTKNLVEAYGIKRYSPDDLSALSPNVEQPQRHESSTGSLT
jgi:hypothetical protein